MECYDLLSIYKPDGSGKVYVYKSKEYTDIH